MDTADGTFPKDATHFNGTMEVREVHALYRFSNSAATHLALLSNFPNRRPFVLTRSFFSGTQRFALHWSGDSHPTWPELEQGLLTSGLVGVPFAGSGLGGFSAKMTP
jgi:alpha 1,3-glucosidase